MNNTLESMIKYCPVEIHENLIIPYGEIKAIYFHHGFDRIIIERVDKPDIQLPKEISITTVMDKYVGAYGRTLYNYSKEYK